MDRNGTINVAELTAAAHAHKSAKDSGGKLGEMLVLGDVMGMLGKCWENAGKMGGLRW